ncbi:MAG: D-alanyl-D-alanine carboxypeptidase family protein [Acidothermales bacterium]|nr:D-alanyl-D-alanine carboxypeptidase family protein [Acidothermales bacterium]
MAALAVAATLLVAPAQPASAAPATTRAQQNVAGLRKQIAELRTKADAATAGLAKSTRAYQAGRVRLRSTQRQLLAAADAEQVAQARLDIARDRLAALAVSAYESPTGDEVTTMLTDPLSGVSRERTTTDVMYLTDQQTDVVAHYTGDVARQTELHRHAQALEHAAQKQQTALDHRRTSLQAQSKRLTSQLLARLDQLTNALVKAGQFGDAFRVSRERMDRMGQPAGAGPCDKPDIGGFPNGLIPPSMLCPLPQRGHMLKPSAARAFWLLDTAYQMRFNRHICVTDSYRPLSVQYSVFRRKPGLAAVPGTSRHGLGDAVDLGCGIQVYGSTQFRWMKQNAPKFGWIHPYWAEHSPFEPWHWEYK